MKSKKQDPFISQSHYPHEKLGFLVKGIDQERGSVCGQDVEQVWQIMLSGLHGTMIDKAP
jgi:hypothetical protein